MTEYKHNKLIVFRGLTYRYNKTYGEFRLVDRSTELLAPKTLCETSGKWTYGPLESQTPTGLLQRWVASMISMKEQEIADLEEILHNKRDVLRRYKRGSLK